MNVEYDPFSPVIMTNPHPTYARMREEAPVFFVERFNCHALTRFEDIWETARDWETFSVERGTTSAQLLSKRMGPYPALGNLDPPRQKERRKLIIPLLLPAKVREFEGPLREIANQQIALMHEQGEIDIVREYAATLAIGGVCLSAGLPIEDAERMREWANAISQRDPERAGLSEAGVIAYEELAHYATELVRHQRSNPENKGGVIERLASAKVEGGRTLDEEEIVGHVREFLIGGIETFQKAFAACVHRLWENPDQRSEAARSPELARSAFLEALRYDTPGQFMGRTVLRDTEIAGVPVFKDQVVLLIWPSGNRDPREFEDPDRFDIHRRQSRMLAFGAGVHDCVGRHLALSEGAVGLSALLDAVPDYDLDLSRSSRLVSEFVQGFTSLPLCAA